MRGRRFFHLLRGRRAPERGRRADATAECEAAVQHIKSRARELADTARGADLGVTAFLLEMAALEADAWLQRRTATAPPRAEPRDERAQQRAGLTLAERTHLKP